MVKPSMRFVAPFVEKTARKIRIVLALDTSISQITAGAKTANALILAQIREMDIPNV
jgi:hypothetical protein